MTAVPPTPNRASKATSVFFCFALRLMCQRGVCGISVVTPATWDRLLGRPAIETGHEAPCWLGQGRKELVSGWRSRIREVVDAMRVGSHRLRKQVDALCPSAALCVPQPNSHPRQPRERTCVDDAGLVFIAQGPLLLYI